MEKEILVTLIFMSALVSLIKASSCNCGPEDLMMQILETKLKTLEKSASAFVEFYEDRRSYKSRILRKNCKELDKKKPILESRACANSFSKVGCIVLEMDFDFLSRAEDLFGHILQLENSTTKPINDDHRQRALHHIGNVKQSAYIALSRVQDALVTNNKTLTRENLFERTTAKLPGTLKDKFTRSSELFSAERWQLDVQAACEVISCTKAIANRYVCHS